MKVSLGTDGSSPSIFKPSGSVYNLWEFISPWFGLSPSASFGINFPHGLVVIGDTKSFVVPYTDEYIIPKKSIFNKMIFDSHFEYEFASFLDGRSDVKTFVKNFEQLNFKIEYQNRERRFGKTSKQL